MALRVYKCLQCNYETRKFDDEAAALFLPADVSNEFIDWKPLSCVNDLCGLHYLEVDAEKCHIVSATSQYMQEYQLDSWKTVYELDRMLNIEAREEKEMTVYQEYARNA